MGMQRLTPHMRPDARGPDGTVSERYSARPPRWARLLDRRTLMLRRPQILFAILTCAVLVTASAAQQEAADRLRMVDEIDAMLASAAGNSGVARLSPRVRAAMIEVPRHEYVPPHNSSSAYGKTPLPIA